MHMVTFNNHVIDTIIRLIIEITNLYTKKDGGNGAILLVETSSSRVYHKGKTDELTVGSLVGCRCTVCYLHPLSIATTRFHQLDRSTSLCLSLGTSLCLSLFNRCGNRFIYYFVHKLQWLARHDPRMKNLGNTTLCLSTVAVGSPHAGITRWIWQLNMKINSHRSTAEILQIPGIFIQICIKSMRIAQANQTLSDGRWESLLNFARHAQNSINSMTSTFSV